MTRTHQLSLFIKGKVQLGKLKHFIQGDQTLYACGFSNYCVRHRWHLFYDLDGQGLVEKTVPIALFPTKHGEIAIDMKCRGLSEVRSEWMYWNGAFGGNYFWSIPLWLRFTPKWNEAGEEVSPSPRIPERIKKHFPMKKMYRTWD